MKEIIDSKDTSRDNYTQQMQAAAAISLNYKSPASWLSLASRRNVRKLTPALSLLASWLCLAPAKML